MKKHSLILVAAILALAGLSAMAADAKSINGCEVKQAENGTFFNLVDPDCVPDRSSRGDDAQTRTAIAFRETLDRLEAEARAAEKAK